MERIGSEDPVELPVVSVELCNTGFIAEEQKTLVVVESRDEGGRYVKGLPDAGKVHPRRLRVNQVGDDGRRGKECAEDGGM